MSGPWDGLTPEEREALPREERRRRLLEWAASIGDPPACPDCGRCVMCGPPCCEPAAARARAAAADRAKQACRDVSARQEARRARKAERRAAYLARAGGVGSDNG